MEYLDIIGIGAINYDYIFFCKESEYKNRMLPEFGQEYLNEKSNPPAMLGRIE